MLSRTEHRNTEYNGILSGVVISKKTFRQISHLQRPSPARRALNALRLYYSRLLAGLIGSSSPIGAKPYIKDLVSQYEHDGTKVFWPSKASEQE